MNHAIHPSQALVDAGEAALPDLPVCDHYCGVEARMRKSLALQAELGPAFDVTLDGEDGAPVGGEVEHAQLMAELVDSPANAFGRVGARVVPVDHPAFEPMLEAWVKKLPPDVAFRRVPVAFRDEPFTAHQKIYYALEALGQVDAMQMKVFNAIHRDHNRMDKPAEIAAFMQKNGIDSAKFLYLYNSFAVQTKTRQARSLAEAYKIDGVPALGINGRYYTSGSLAGSLERGGRRRVEERERLDIRPPGGRIHHEGHERVPVDLRRCRRREPRSRAP